MQHDSNATIAQNLRVGIVANLATLRIPLATNHPNRFRMSHHLSPLVNLKHTIFIGQRKRKSLKNFF
jgi:hypothetical protein